MKTLIFPVFLLASACSFNPAREAARPECPTSFSQTSENASPSNAPMEYLPASYHRDQRIERLQRAKRGRNLYLGAGMAGLNNPTNPSGDVDNVAVAVGGKLSLRHISLRPEMQLAERSNAFNATLSRDFAIAGNGLGAIEGNLGVGYSTTTGHENNVLGNSNTPYLRLGAEGYLAGNIVTGAALMIAPWGYNGDATAIAGVGYFGFSF